MYATWLYFYNKRDALLHAKHLLKSLSPELLAVYILSDWFSLGRKKKGIPVFKHEIIETTHATVTDRISQARLTEQVRVWSDYFFFSNDKKY